MDLGRRGWSTLAALFGVLALLAGCSNNIAGSPLPAEIPALSADESISQSLLNFGEAGVVRYKGTLVSASDEKIAFDLTVSHIGEVLGTITVNDAPANVLMVNKTFYVKAPAAFWAALRGIGNAEDKGTAIADRWVKLPTVLLGVDFGELLTPDVVAQNLSKQPPTGGSGALGERPRTTEAGVEAIKVPMESGAVFLAAEQPHGLVKLALSKFGGTDNTRVKDLLADIGEASADAGTFYAELARQAGELKTAVDALTTVQQGNHRFEGCGPESCSLIVEFTNTAKVPVRVHVRANWTGDNAPLGACEVEVGPVAPGAASTATCKLATPEWAAFWNRAHSVVGTHPYGASWAPLVLADAPDLAAINARAGAKPADPNSRKTEGSHYVYTIAHGDKVWKYGVVGSKYWQEHANDQLRTCLATNRAVCTFSLVTATDEPGSAYALQNQLVQKYRSEKGTCPTGQWVGCKR